MESRELDDIRQMAQQESAEAGHYYIGVEHYFVAMTRLRGGVTAGTLEEQGVEPRFVRYMIRQEVGKGDGRRFWPGFRETPRLHTVLRIALELAKAKGQGVPTERELLLAILREAESVPYRVLSRMGVDLDRLEVEVANWSAQQRPVTPPVPIEVDGELDPELTQMEMLVLQQMFRGYSRVVVERQLVGGFTHARVLVASPIRVGGKADASVVVKLDERMAIQYEKMRYDTYVRDTLPPATAHVLAIVVPDRSTMGGLKYTFVRSGGDDAPVDLADYARAYGPAAVSDLLWHGLYEVFGETWWKQRSDYAFSAWQEYEMALPAAIVVEALREPASATRRLTPEDQWIRRGRFAQDAGILLEGCTVTDFYPARGGIQLAAGGGPEALSRTCKVEVRGIQWPSKEFHRGAFVERLLGRVRATRDDLLYDATMALNPPFDVRADRLPDHPAFRTQLPNPLRRYQNLLQRTIGGSQSIIHGDLHAHNILMGPGGNAWLIDFAETREGHTLFDWAVLEASLLTEIVAPAMESDRWDEVWPVVSLLAEIGETGRAPLGRLPVEQALECIAALRKIVGECLARPGNWQEYYVALAFCTLRGLRWRAISARGRRLLYLTSALAMLSAGGGPGRDANLETSRDLDMTDFGVMLTDHSSERNLMPPTESSPSSPSSETPDNPSGKSRPGT